MRKALLTLFAAMLSFSASWAQDSANAPVSATFTGLKYTDKQNSTPRPQPGSPDIVLQQDSYYDAVVAAVNTGLTGVRRLVVSDGEYLAGAVNTPYVIDGTIYSITTTVHHSKPEGDRPGRDSYKSAVSLIVNLKNAADFSTVDSYTFKVEQALSSSTVEESMTDALNSLSRKVAKTFNSLFPTTAHIIERGEIKKDEQKEVYIDLGAAHGVYHDLQFVVYAVRTIAGREAKETIGKIKVDKVMGDDISLCKVNKNSKEIKTALDEGLTLIAVSE